MMKTSTSSGIKNCLPMKNSPNLKEICDDSDLDTPEKTSTVETRGKHVINNINEICERHRESLAAVLPYKCTFGQAEAKAVLNEVIETKEYLKYAVNEPSYFSLEQLNQWIQHFDFGNADSSNRPSTIAGQTLGSPTNLLIQKGNMYYRYVLVFIN